MGKYVLNDTILYSFSWYQNAATLLTLAGEMVKMVNSP